MTGKMFKIQILKRLIRIPNIAVISPIDVFSQRSCSSSTNEFTENATATKLKPEKTINEITLLGRVGDVPRTRGSEIHPVVLFPLATTNSFYREEELIQNTEWHRIAVFRPQLREIITKHVGKGQRVLVRGRLTYVDRKAVSEEGHIIKSSSIIADDITFFK